jgi:hypothetical protein
MTIMRRAGVAVLMTLAFATVATARLVISSGAMSGVHLGDTMGQVRNKLGPPQTTVHNRYTSINWFYSPSAPVAVVSFDDRRLLVDNLSTVNREQRTANGVGVGSTYRDLFRLVPGLQCASRQQICQVLVWKKRKTYQTSFDMVNGRAADVQMTLWWFTMRCRVRTGFFECHPHPYNR